MSTTAVACTKKIQADYFWSDGGSYSTNDRNQINEKHFIMDFQWIPSRPAN